MYHTSEAQTRRDKQSNNATSVECEGWIVRVWESKDINQSRSFIPPRGSEEEKKLSNDLQAQTDVLE